MIPFTPSQLEHSVYYAGPGIDLQPLLRFGDLSDLFIYVNLCVPKEDIIRLITGASATIAEETQELLTLVSVEELTPPNEEPFFLRSPVPFFISEDVQSYQETVDASKDFPVYLLHFTFRLHLNGEHKPLHLYYFMGEGIATYDEWYARQAVAPQIFISIQTGSLEYPGFFSDKMFSLHKQIPKVWVRGLWDKYAIHQFVFHPYGLFDRRIATYTEWNGHMGQNADQERSHLTNPLNRDNLVQAFGAADIWNTAPPSQELNRPQIRLRKFQRAFNKVSDAPLYDCCSQTAAEEALWEAYLPIAQYLEQLPVRKHTPTLLLRDQLHIVQLEYQHAAAQGASCYCRALLPAGFQAEAVLLDSFVDTFQPIAGTDLQLDVFFEHLLDYGCMPVRVYPE
ncbi:MAG: hypothetical protein ACKOAY_07145 [Haliscomenobacter sp.]